MKTTIMLAAMLLFVQPVHAEGLCDVIDCKSFENATVLTAEQLSAKLHDLEDRVKVLEEERTVEAVTTWAYTTSAPSDPTEQHINALEMIHAEEMASGRTDKPFREWLVDRLDEHEMN